MEPETYRIYLTEFHGSQRIDAGGDGNLGRAEGAA